jgi:hypothetical protein
MNLREAAQQALEALEFDGFTPEDATHRHYTTKAITAIRAALAAPSVPSEPVAWIDADGDVYKTEPAGNWCPPHRPLYTTPQPAPAGEPVAWVYTGVKADGTEHGPHLVWSPAYMDAMSASKGAKAAPLYATPQATTAKELAMRAALLLCARQAEALKRECGTDPESAQAVRNAQYQAISTTAHIAIGTVRGPEAP